MNFGGIRLGRTKYITQDEFGELLSVTEKESELYFYAFFICGNLGLRVGELVALKKSDFDFKNNLVSIKTLKQRKKIKNHLKVAPETMVSIKGFVEKVSDQDKKLFDVTTRTMQLKFDYFAGKAGLKIKPVGTKQGAKGRGIHCLRHLKGVILAERTRDPFVIARAMRHSNISTSMEYVNLKDYNKTIDEIGSIGLPTGKKPEKENKKDGKLQKDIKRGNN